MKLDLDKFRVRLLAKDALENVFVDAHDTTLKYEAAVFEFEVQSKRSESKVHSQLEFCLSLLVLLLELEANWLD